MQAKVKPIPYSPNAIRAALVNLKGAERGAATFEAVAPVFSATIANGGTKAELSATTATAQVFKELHAETLKTSTAKAFRAVCASALADFAKNGRADTQDNHDARMLSLSAQWCGFFRDAAPAKPKEGETLSAKCARLMAENAALMGENAALRAELTRIKAKPAKVKADQPASVTA